MGSVPLEMSSVPVRELAGERKQGIRCTMSRQTALKTVQEGRSEPSRRPGISPAGWGFPFDSREAFTNTHVPSLKSPQNCIDHTLIKRKNVYLTRS